jgi:membrane protease YdiL (CAAX protease family)
MTDPTPATGVFCGNEFTLRYEEVMNEKKILQIGLLVLIGMLIWGPVASSLTNLLLPDADSLQSYLLNKGLFVVLLLAVMSKIGGLKFFGIERGSSWWFLVPGLPFLFLTAAVFFDPNAAFGLSTPATVGWILVSLFVGIGEESVFRGILWRAFEARGILVTAIATSALFGAVHLIGLFTDIPWQIITSQAVFAFGVGMMFAAVRLVSGSLLAPIILHAVFDAGAIVAAGGVNEMLDDTMSVERLLIPGALFAVWGLVSILIIRKRRSKAPS